jgi:hypothetical protein
MPPPLLGACASRLARAYALGVWRDEFFAMQRAASRPPQTAGGIATALTAPRSRTRRRSSPRGRPRVATPCRSRWARLKLAHLLPLRVGYEWDQLPPLGSKLPRPRTQHLRRDQKGTPHRTPPGHSPPTRRIAQGPLGAAHTQSRIGRLRLSQADSRQGEERGEREREERGEGEGVCTRVEQGGCLWWAIVILRG